MGKAGNVSNIRLRTKSTENWVLSLASLPTAMLAPALKAIARWNFLLRRDLGHGNDNSPMWINAAA
jgi:hypothetical protein